MHRKNGVRARVGSRARLCPLLRNDTPGSNLHGRIVTSKDDADRRRKRVSGMAPLWDRCRPLDLHSFGPRRRQNPPWRMPARNFFRASWLIAAICSETKWSLRRYPDDCCQTENCSRTRTKPALKPTLRRLSVSTSAQEKKALFRDGSFVGSLSTVGFAQLWPQASAKSAMADAGALQSPPWDPA